MTQVRERFAQVFTRSSQRVANVLGIVATQDLANAKVKKFRNDMLEVYDAYYENRQYAGLCTWEIPVDSEYIPVRKRQPLLQLSLGKTLCTRIVSKLMGHNTFPTLKVEDDPDTEMFIKTIVQTTKLESRLLEPMRRLFASGSVLVRFSVINGFYKVEHFLSKYCYPEFDVLGNLQSVMIRYVYEDFSELDQKGAPKQKWFRMDLGPIKDVLFDNPPYDPMVEPVFTEKSVAEHNLGFVQAEWFRTYENRHSPDGPSLIADAMPFIDDLNYSLSQSSQAIAYNQDPQLTIKGLDEDELDKLVKSSMKAWNLGKEGEAGFIEAGMTGVKAAMENRDKMKVLLQDIVRVTLLDPEKMSATAQSGKAMEVLHGPMVEFICEMRPLLEEKLVSLVTKMALATLMLNKQGVQTQIAIPPGYEPQSLNVTVLWPEVFQKTIEDLQKKVSIASTVSSANLISRETMLKWIAKDFDVENIEEEVAKIAAQPVFNPFGGGF